MYTQAAGWGTRTAKTFRVPSEFIFAPAAKSSFFAAGQEKL
jgi:hypothetical protein